MKGDFSQLNFQPVDNFTGVWHQQGRVLLDQDWNAETEIARHLRELLGQDVIGPDLVGIPAAEPDSWRVVSAESDGSGVEVTVEPGRGWIDGLHLYIPGEMPLVLPTTWFGPPIDDPQPDAASIAAGERDAVILEAWEEAFSAFQDPQCLLEPALGGPDTTERSILHYRLRLLRLRDGEDCGNLERLLDDPDQQGHLTVTPAPTLAIGGDCPVQAGGGYSGFEHYLFRIEVASPTTDGEARFKYSRFNGGLVGRGTFDNALDQISVLANDQMIDHCGLDDFFLEVLAPHDSGTYWEVVMEADASSVGDGVLSLTNIVGAWPGAASDEAFFRLWDGTRLIQTFATGAPVDFELGLRLTFDPPTADNANYRPGDYWTFPLRTAGTDFDPAVWPADAPPHGVTYHRAPLAILNWNAGPVVTLDGPPDIHDCRRVFQPLTRIQTCCTYKVGDGLHSFGDFATIQDAVDHLPPSGGEICVLPGTYEESVVIDKDNVRIHGCGPRSRVVGRPATDDVGTPEPVFLAEGRRNVRIDSLGVEAAPRGIGITIESDEQGVECRGIRLLGLEVHAGADSAIKIAGANEVVVRDCLLLADDVASGWAPLFLLGDDVLVEHNRIQVIPRRIASDSLTAAPVAAPPPTPASIQVEAGRGGIHIAGTCERIQVIDNDIFGGIGHGITLGSVETVDEDGNVGPGLIGWIVNVQDPCDPCAPGSVYLPPGGDPDTGVTYQSAGALYDIRIERNRIHGMGLCGIGVVAFFNLDEADEFISVHGLDILGNELRDNLWRDLQALPQEAQGYMGYGAIGLADVEALRIHDNVIEDNGPDHLQPVCGIFVLHVEGLDIGRNRVRNNGQQTEEDAEEAFSGRRGGIVVPYALPGIDALDVGREFRPRQNGVPAARIHDNIVSQPLGQALALGGLGPMSVQGNQLTSQALVPRSGDPSFWATTVLIVNYGLSNEFYLQTMLFRGATADPVDAGDLPSGGDGFIPAPTRGLDDQGIGRYLANGNVLFADNQLFLDLSEVDVDFAISQAAIVSLDDVAVQNNQFDCDFRVDILFTNLLTVGMTVRVQDNRFKETLMIALFSSVALGLVFNNTSDNQATHCFLNLESPLAALPFLTPSIREHDNQVLFNAFSFLTFWCEALSNWRRILVPNQDLSATNSAQVNTSVGIDNGLNMLWRDQ
ncbi:hypothetical protein GCM10007160_03900 [Litchfieldella qijiaojingensis]|uniref:Right handed beta helix domain-containing protein n=1 Tax=Litchfieldella qijiaojingensis TaxID=980347 RepID=A0ABQ2YD61_9GAMM|nr:DUF6519 domain-containing protein [Halomonas qijiaojingensis]GGX79731.1 hypothetical protein GCM10007160_03900 [Halomonas qijiaojingensis]